MEVIYHGWHSLDKVLYVGTILNHTPIFEWNMACSLEWKPKRHVSKIDLRSDLGTLLSHLIVNVYITCVEAFFGWGGRDYLS